MEGGYRSDSDNLLEDLYGTKQCGNLEMTIEQ